MDLFYRILLVYLVCAFSACAHKCMHDEYMASKNVTLITSPQTYLHHPFETRSDANASRRELSPKWEPLRIHVDTSSLAGMQLSDDARQKLHRVTSSALPLAIKILTKHLHVIRVDGNLKITPECLADSDGETANTETTICVWADTNTCLDTPVPDSHKLIGIPDADFVIYLNVNENDNGGNTMAFGGTCRVDQYDRPLAGQIEINLAAFEDTFPTNYVVTAFAHELSHSLGWIHKSFGKFRDVNGNLRENVVTTKNALGKSVTVLSTPAITKYVRSYFGCESLDGMELEDQGGDGTAGSHPEKRIFPESYMAGLIIGDKSSYIIDAMALSVFQDSGWYQVKHLDQAGHLSWGRGMGCRVATHKCNDWGTEAGERGMFCSQKGQTFCLGNQKHMVGECSLHEYDNPLPSMFQYFSSPTIGGGLGIADYCPRAAEYSNGDCTDPKNRAALGPALGPSSRCFMSTLGTQSGSPPSAHCMQRTCTAEALKIHIGFRTAVCPVSNHATSVPVLGASGYIVCPPYSGLADIRCGKTCSRDDSACLEPKSVPESVASALPPAPTTEKMKSISIFDAFKGLFSGNSGNSPVVVHGRKLLRG